LPIGVEVAEVDAASNATELACLLNLTGALGLVPLQRFIAEERQLVAAAAIGVVVAPTTLKLATWNLEWLNQAPRTGRVERTDADYARLKKYADRLDADVIAVQEVDGEAALRRVFDDARYDYHVTSQNDVQRAGFVYRSSVAVRRNTDLTELDVGGLRTGADLTVIVEGHPVRLLSVHLESGCFDQPLNTPSSACRQLAAQLPVLGAWVDARIAASDTFIVLGDFNRRLKAGEAFYSDIDDDDPATPGLTLATDGRTSTCWGGQFPQLVDHIILSPAATRWLVSGSFSMLDYERADEAFRATLSDHCAVSVSLTPRAPDHEQSPGPEPIKGNITSAGRKLYHLPICPGYAETQIDVSKGERLFAGEADARAAGWQKAANCP
jgi:endonuclease/exonuclease/phosphatase family metal-dependent hydrolase